MLGLEYEIVQYYTFKYLYGMIIIMALTEAKNYELDEEQKIIKYKIDKKKCISLTELLYGIEQNFIKMHIGQFLELFKKLINYVLKLNQLGIDHEYLDTNRIWLVLNYQSEYFNIIHQKLFYEIQFTGYQCPFYEQSQADSIPSAEKIKMIIKEIIISFMNKKVFEISDSNYKKIKQDIFEILIYQLQQQNLQEIVKQIIEFMQKYNYDETNQSIKLDDNSYYVLRTYKNYSQVKQGFETVVQNYRNNQVILDQIIHQLISSNVHNVDAFWYNWPNEYIETSIKSLEKRNHDLKQQFEDRIFRNIVVQLSSQLELMNKLYKFSFDSQKMAQEIKAVIMSSKKLEYFNNSHELYDKYKKPFIQLKNQLILRFKLKFQN